MFASGGSPWGGFGDQVCSGGAWFDHVYSRWGDHGRGNRRSPGSKDHRPGVNVINGQLVGVNLIDRQLVGGKRDRDGCSGPRKRDHHRR